ncbi:MAG: hypothetical protein MUP85_23075 [Candidatus Lokiarchaeota archaeon]|nr:hypothetical protein [Candidatus Lokiarchaeota archaeon]
MEKFCCSSCNYEKEGKKLEWYEIFSHTNRGVKLDEELIYVCNNCGAKICKDCKEQKVKGSTWSGWEKAICPCCYKYFAPAVLQEIDRGKKIQENKIRIKNEKLIGENKNLTEKSNGDIHKNNSTKTINDDLVYIPASVSILKLFAWLDLIASFIFAIIIWSEPTHYSIGFGIGVLLQGIFVCALFLVIAIIAENLIVINHKTTKLNNRMSV